VKTAHTFASVYAQNQGDGTFAVEVLPSRAQFAPIHGTLVHDLDANGTRDVMLGGNFYAVKPKQGRYDASYGTVLRGDSSGHWDPAPPPESNLYLRGEVRALRLLKRADGTHFVLVARNDARPQVVRLRGTDAP